MTIKKHFEKQAENLAISKLNQLNLPRALLIIPDGNGRWAKNLGLTVYEGHKKGGEVFAKILENFLKININVLGAWGFSEDNWKRPTEEINRIMEVIEYTILNNLQKMIDNNIKFLVLGNITRIEKEYPNLFQAITEGMTKTSADTAKTFALFVDYGERFCLEEFAKERQTDKFSTTQELLTKIHQGLPLFDMVLRTSGELRLSGFGPLADMAEFVSVKKNLPDFSDADLAKALIEYSKRQRRFGGR